MANKANETNNVDYIMEQINSISSDKFHAEKINNYIQLTASNRSYYLSFNPKDTFFSMTDLELFVYIFETNVIFSLADKLP